jgi:hypothetical protein
MLLNPLFCSSLRLLQPVYQGILHVLQLPGRLRPQLLQRRLSCHRPDLGILFCPPTCSTMQFVALRCMPTCLDGQVLVCGGEGVMVQQESTFGTVERP